MKEVEKACIIRLLKDSYRRAGKKQKGIILEDLCKRLSVSRKHAIRLMSPLETGRPRKPGRRGRPSKYQDPEFKTALRLVWKTTRYMCSRALVEAIPDWLPAMAEEGITFLPDIRARLLSISHSTADRILKPYKVKKGKSFTRNTGFRDEIQIQENIWNIKTPGFMESDTVAHCGASMHGEFVNSLTMVDIATIWTETLAVFGRGSRPTLEALKQIEESLPFEILGYDADNGGEVLNKHIVSYFGQERIAQGRKPVQVTRSRAYKKNDNAHVEQRNDSIARRYLGYERLEYDQLLPLINFYYSEVVCPLQNHFFPTFKLKNKVRVKSRTRRIYDKPITPYQRLIESEHLTTERKDALKIWHQQLNPVRLVRMEATLRKQIDNANRKLKAGIKLTNRDLQVPDIKRPKLNPQNTVSTHQIYKPINHTNSIHAHNFR